MTTCSRRSRTPLLLTLELPRHHSTGHLIRILQTAEHLQGGREGGRRGGGEGGREGGW